MVQKFISQHGAKFLSEIEASITSKRYFNRCFTSHFMDTADFYKLSEHDKELIRKDMDDVAEQLAYFCLSYTERLAWKKKVIERLFTEKEIREAPLNAKD